MVQSSRQDYGSNDECKGNQKLPQETGHKIKQHHNTQRNLIERRS
jgi:hypothetical protein